MPWFAAHVVMHFRMTDGRQDRFTGYENVFLVEAETAEQAIQLGADIGRADEGDSGGTLTVVGRPARLTFVGVRKVVKVLHAPGVRQVGAGDEVTYSEFEVVDQDCLHRFARGEAVPLQWIE